MANDDQGFEAMALDRIASQANGLIDGIAARMGMPPGAKKYTREEERREWTHTPYPDPQERMSKALEMHLQGATSEEITDALYPNLRKLITTSRPNVPEQIAFAKQMRSHVGWPEQVPSFDGLGTGFAPDQPAAPPMAEPVAPEPPPLPEPAMPEVQPPTPAGGLMPVMPALEQVRNPAPPVLPGIMNGIGG